MTEPVVAEKQWYVLWIGTLDTNKLINTIANNFDAEIWIPSYSKVLTDGTSEKVPMYPSYFLVKCVPETTDAIEAQCRELRYKSVQFLRCAESRSPLKVTEDEVIAIQELEASFEESEEFAIGEEIIICNGPFTDYKGTIREIQKAYVKVEFLFFGSESRTISVKKEHCQKIK